MEKKPTSGLAVAGLVLGVLALLVTAAMYGGASAASDGSSESTPVAEQGASQDALARAEQGASQDAPAQAEQEAASDYAVTIDDCRMTEDYEGNPAAVVTFTFTNNSEETTSPAVALHAQVFQNGTELEMAITTDNEDADKYMNDVKPGSSITYGLAYELEDTSDITVEVQELAAFNDVLLAGIAPAGGQPAFAGGRRQRAVLQEPSRCHYYFRSQSWLYAAEDRRGAVPLRGDDDRLRTHQVGTGPPRTLPGRQSRRPMVP